MRLFICLMFLISTTLVSASKNEKHDDDKEESSAAVGPDKGITEKSNLGLKISTQALQTIDLKTLDVNSEIIEIPLQALVKVKDTKSVFRVRDNWYKRVETTIVQKKTSTYLIKSAELLRGDKIVIVGTGYLRTAEVYSEEGATHSH